MKLIKLAAAVLNQTPLDWRGNRRNILDAIGMARDAGASVLCLPELCVTGYGCEDAFHSPGVLDRAWTELHGILPHTRGMVVSLGVPVMLRKSIFNMAALAADGVLAGFTGKRHLAGDGVHYEPRWFKSWPEGVADAVPGPDGEQIPCGDLLYDIGGVRFGFEICEDAWVAERPGIGLALNGADVILNPSASHFAFGKNAVRQRFVLEGSRAFHAAYVYANMLGNESGRIIFDGEAMIAAGGRLLATAERFSFRDINIITAQADIGELRMNQARTAGYRPTFTTPPARILAKPFTWPDIEPELPQARLAPWEATFKDLKAEEFARAVPLALFDYLRKSRSRGFVVSLSGGADSTALVALIRLMAEISLAQIGPEGVREKLSYIPDIQNVETASDLVRALLTTAYQASENSGDVTRQAARAVAEGAGARHLEFDITALVKGYTEMVEGGIGRTLTWERDDLALQNIQARVRSPGIWMVANVLNALLLSTSNRSEAAVGYATMDGDTSGGLAPISGIDKAWLREWLRWMETRGPAGIGHMPFLKAVNVQAPTAELRPQENAQTDESDLMPYPLLDAIERAAIRDKHLPVDVFRLMRLRFPQYETAQLAAWVERFFQLWCHNQWKRERYAPGFHVDDENLDPKTWCRFPILSSGFNEELVDLREYVKGLAG